MNPDDKTLEDEFLELHLRQQKEGDALRDLSASVRNAWESGSNEEEDSMSSTTFTLPASEENRFRFNQRLFMIVANAACIIAVAFLVANIWNKAPIENPHAVAPVDQEAEEGKQTRPVKSGAVYKLADIKKLPIDVTHVVCSSGDFDDAALLELCRTRQDIYHLEIRSSWVTHKGVQEIPKLENLRELVIEWNDYIGKPGWEVISRMRSLEKLHLGHFLGQTAMISDMNVPQPPRYGMQPGPFMYPELIRNPNLRDLNLTGHNTTDQDLKMIVDAMKDRLLAIDVSDTDVTNAGLRELARCPQLRTLGATTKKKDNQDFLFAISEVTSLKQLTLATVGRDSGHFIVKTDALRALGKLPDLEVLRINQMNFKDARLDELLTHKKLKELRLAYCTGLTDDDLKVLPQFKQLKTLMLANCGTPKKTNLRDVLSSTANEIDLRGTFDELDTTTLKKVLDARPGLVVTLWNGDARAKDLKGYVAKAEAYGLLVLKNPGKIQPKRRK